jgi:hypothetical protein
LPNTIEYYRAFNLLMILASIGGSVAGSFFSKRLEDIYQLLIKSY